MNNSSVQTMQEIQELAEKAVALVRRSLALHERLLEAAENSKTPSIPNTRHLVSCLTALRKAQEIIKHAQAMAPNNKNDDQNRRLDPEALRKFLLEED